ncbi:MAG: hypothetical protein MI702_11740 [Chlorobiales bacterium]|nr:hypothetical protein [Chlorobiales bacterium]
MKDLTQILCHRPPMIFLDEVAEYGDDYLTAVVQIREGIPFYRNPDGVPAWVGIEYMAQAIAAFAGIRAKNAGNPIPLGLLIGCRRYAANRPGFAPGERIEVCIKELAAEEYGLGSFDCTLNLPETVAQARLSVYGGPREAAP